MLGGGTSTQKILTFFGGGGFTSAPKLLTKQLPVGAVRRPFGQFSCQLRDWSHGVLLHIGHEFLAFDWLNRKLRRVD